MFRDKIKRQSKLDEPIDKVLSEMTEFGPETSEYSTLLDQLERLHKMRREENPLIPTGDAVVTAAASILGILTIVHFERFNVLTSKAMGQLLRSKQSN
jgi:hypothetical protein